MLFTEKYRPRKLNELAGNSETIEKIRRWALEWEQNKRQQPLLLHGAVGTGKTAAAYALAHEFDWEMLEMNASGLRDEGNIKRIAGAAGTSLSLSGKRKLILLDDADSLQGREDRGGAGAISELLESARQPVVLTAHDLWDKKLSGIRGSCIKLEFKKVNSGSIASVLRKIAKAEGIHSDEQLISKIAGSCSGDVRSAINDLQAFNGLGERDREKNIFETLRSIFKSRSYADARSAAFDAETDRDMLKMWIDENIPLELDSPEELAAAYGNLSRADIFDGRIVKRQYWGFLRYSGDLMSAGVSLCRDGSPLRFATYSFPSYIRTMGATKTSRAMRKKIGAKLGRLLHCSSSDAEAYFSLVKSECAKSIEKVKSLYSLENDELAFLLGKTEKEVERLLEASEKKQERHEEDKEAKEAHPIKEKAKKESAGKGKQKSKGDPPADEKKTNEPDPPAPPITKQAEKPVACKLSDFC